MDFKPNHSLQTYNTFGIDAKAKLFVEINSKEELFTLLKTAAFKNEPSLFLGGGSNLLLTKDVDGLVIKNNIKGIQIIEEDDSTILIEANSGEVWHDLVLHTIDRNWGGLENLSYIPGTVGAAPIQNIGAYGVELKDTFYALKAINLKTGKEKIFNRDECNFGYRMSLFKQELKGLYFILSVQFKLNKNPLTNVSYGAIKETLIANKINRPSIKNVSDAVISIRKSKLPDPAEIGNSGSFFKNPIISKEHFLDLQKEFPQIVHYQVDESKIKIPAGWLIEQCGWKGKRIGNTGSHKNQALVLVNYGEASGVEIHQLSKDIQKSVKNKFNIDIEVEVNIL